MNSVWITPSIYKESSRSLLNGQAEHRQATVAKECGFPISFKEFLKILSLFFFFNAGKWQILIYCSQEILDSP